MIYAPDVLRHLSAAGYGGDRGRGPARARWRRRRSSLGGRYDRTCVVQASEAIGGGIPGSELVVFERSGHMTFVEEPERYVAVVRSFLQRYA